jgi:SNF2 family DNA or RNA helicase
VRARQAIEEARIKREQEDYLLAKRLQNTSSGSFGASSSSGPSAFSHMMGTPVGSRPQQSSSNAPGMKPEPKPSPRSRFPMPGTFESPSSDSDIEIISATTFQDNYRRHTYDKSKATNTMSYHLSGSASQPSNCSGVARQNMAQRTGVYSNTSLTLNPYTPQAGHFTPSQHADRNFYSPRDRLQVHNANHYSSGNTQVYGAGNILANQGLSHSYPGSMFNMVGDALSNTINRTVAYSGGYDMQGNPLDPRAAAISDLIHDPRKTEQEIKELLENIRPDDDLPKENREGTPEALKYPLMEHQKMSLSWMKAMEEGTNKGGILADDMGLGKTISTLALMVSRPSSERNRQTTLIVGPVALVRQWQREIQEKIKRTHPLSVYLAHGSKKMPWSELRTYKVVITTYGTISSEFTRLGKYNEELRRNPNKVFTAVQKNFPFLGTESLWYRVVLDEAQCIKNKNTKAALAACSLKSVTRWCLTGTPMMNGVHELYSLIRFLRIKPYNEQQRFNEDFGGLTQGDQTRNDVQRSMKKLQAVLKAILLRRSKTSRVDGEPILKNLPLITTEVTHVVFDAEQQAYYSALETQTQLKFNKYLKNGSVGKNYSNILVLLLRLRQCCCHPQLIMDFDEAAPPLALENMIQLAKTLTPGVIARLKAAECFECPVCYDATPNPTIMLPCGHDACSECLAKISDQTLQQAQANDGTNIESKCPTCRGKFSMARVIDYETFKQVHLPQEISASQISNGDDNSVSDSDSESVDSEDESEDEISTDEGNLRGFIVPDGYESGDIEDDGCETESEESSEFKKSVQVKREQKADDIHSHADMKSSSASVKAAGKAHTADGAATESETDDDGEFRSLDSMFSRQSARFKSSKPFNKDKGKRRSKSKGKGKAVGGPKAKRTIAMLKKEANKSIDHRKRYMKYLKKHWEPSAKIEKTLEIIQKIQDDTQEKTIIFSQWTTLLDLLEVPLKYHLKLKYRRYDGTMSAIMRDSAARSFTDDSSIKIMLISLKAGNAGLNLVAASQVIILDPFW